MMMTMDNDDDYFVWCSAVNVGVVFFLFVIFRLLLRLVVMKDGDSTPDVDDVIASLDYVQVSDDDDETMKLT